MTTELRMPPLDHFTRAELVELIGILHGAINEARRDYRLLAETTQSALDTLRTVAAAAAAP